MSEPLVKIESLYKSFSNEVPPAISHMNAVIPTGQIFGLAGPDGAGKTTLIRLMAGLLLPTSGSIAVAGFDTATQAEAIHGLIGYMPQKFGLYEDLSVSQNLNLYAALRGLEERKRPEVFKRLLQFTSLTPFVDRVVGELSGGMKQKLGLACALIKKPTLLLLDEPSVGVDPISRKELWKMVQNLLQEGITVLWSTAYLDEAEKCDQVLLLHEGKILYQGPPKKLSLEVKDRVFKMSPQGIGSRKLLTETLQNEEVLDGVIQGSEVRVVMRQKGLGGLELLQKNYPHVKITSSPPRFEDAFVTILGGGPRGTSELAQSTPEISPKKEAIVVAEELTRKFGSFTAAEQISFEIHQGEIFGLLGPNGAGKSTTFKMMCGLLTPTQGKAYVNGLNLQLAPGPARAQIGYMAQKFSLYGNLSVEQNLSFFSGIYNLRGTAQREAIERMSQVFDFKPYLNTSAEALPLGFKQRLALACATMHHPAVLFLDEPTSGVDPIARREFWNHINGLVEKRVTVMVTTHFMDEAEYCDRIGLIYRSKMIQTGTPDELKSLARSAENPSPSLEDAFIKLIEEYDITHPY